MVLVEINQKKGIKENSRMEPAAWGLFLIGYWSLGRRVGDMMRDRGMGAWMHGCMVAWMHGCMDAWMHGCMDAWMHGCMDAWLHGCIYEG